MDVTLAFLTFDLENDPLPGGEGDCKYDWLEVWDGLPGGETWTGFRRWIRSSNLGADFKTAPAPLLTEPEPQLFQ